MRHLLHVSSMPQWKKRKHFAKSTDRHKVPRNKFRTKSVLIREHFGVSPKVSRTQTLEIDQQPSFFEPRYSMVTAFGNGHDNSPIEDNPRSHLIHLKKSKYWGSICPPMPRLGHGQSGESGRRPTLPGHLMWSRYNTWLRVHLDGNDEKVYKLRHTIDSGTIPLCSGSKATSPSAKPGLTPSCICQSQFTPKAKTLLMDINLNSRLQATQWLSCTRHVLEKKKRQGTSTPMRENSRPESKWSFEEL